MGDELRADDYFGLSSAVLICEHCVPASNRSILHIPPPQSLHFVVVLDDINRQPCAYQSESSWRF